ncbi:MotA/TolQ/ExbB proton channel family protein [Oceanicoccus sagamiensis]|uniref:Energy transducer TonB n=1 Tax=Oceanicoccus sagamiensis TaxID=716816 RepID=A0A1X9N926_9GAMM|nr:MotA/TolQ/ExbB proton channel family protein [Oceanicoccus sagamiensis]ARN73681.1 energy transducer TonB [Oceanicoccus sagamiensis]
MKMSLIKSAVVASVLAIASSTVMAQDARSLDQLLNFVKQGQATEAKENKAREARFKNAKNRQAQLLAEAKVMRKNEEDRSARLENTFEQNELKVAEKQRQLKERLGTLTELFGHLTSTAGDLRSSFGNSLISAQYPGRDEFLDELIAKMSGAEQLPSIEEIERLWFEIQREMTESGKVVSFTAEVAKPGGEKESRTVVRVGTFNVISDEGRYLQYIAETNTLAELARQPSGAYIGWASDLAGSTSGKVPFGADPTGPSGGSFLAALINSPTIEERWHQGGNVGYAITAVGALAFLLAIWRLIVLAAMSSKVSAQLKSDKANTNNPLGRVLMVHEQNPTMDTETLELKLSEAVMKEVPKIEFGLNLLKIIAAVAPLMGLLGTVTGMIITFQAITIFGAGDPKAMAGGISGALVTTVLGLLVAIPTVLLHTVTNGQAKKVIHVLDEQSTGIIAEHTEAQLGK